MFKEMKGSIIYSNLKKETNVYWFNEFGDQLSDYKLLGAITGLALYNRVILDTHFPLVIYKKLLCLPLVLEDIKDINPV